DLLHRQEHAVVRRLAEGGLGAGQRAVLADEDGVAAARRRALVLGLGAGCGASLLALLVLAAGPEDGEGREAPREECPRNHGDLAIPERSRSVKTRCIR